MNCKNMNYKTQSTCVYYHQSFEPIFRISFSIRLRYNEVCEEREFFLYASRGINRAEYFEWNRGRRAGRKSRVTRNVSARYQNPSRDNAHASCHPRRVGFAVKLESSARSEAARAFADIKVSYARTHAPTARLPLILDRPVYARSYLPGGA